MKKQIQTTKAPSAIGPYSQGIQASGQLVVVSGQLPIEPTTGTMPEGIEAQTRQSLTNMQAILEAAGCTMADVIKTTVYLSDIQNFAAMNEVYAQFFQGVCPARSAFQVAALPKNALVEIEAFAIKGE